MGYSFLEASAKAKIANFATNLGALTVFAARWVSSSVKVGARHGGGQPRSAATSGARTAVSRGSGFVRVVFIVVVSAFIVRIGGSLLGWWP